MLYQEAKIQAQRVIKELETKRKRPTPFWSPRHPRRPQGKPIRLD